MAWVPKRLGLLHKRSPRRSPEPSKIHCCNLVTFEWKEAAQEVYVSGSWVEWNIKVRLHQDADGVWRTECHVPPGSHQYKFIVDGVWRNAEDCDIVLDSAGHQNHPLVVDEPTLLTGQIRKPLPTTA
eukprot:CAMPEP_0175857192 /NCGR_PEP_ID=MMETSP0107_2-20121207/28956_1 /TAXON_ID=195067 ORGANISM="Goniomonas pacifica, Strain CCMP1869" /NCGR_SAMPLE_ID=MMETSP0107_2 /ASSEMBLY_ACC=CAM_ASM_000203 /LENGTH=126 /DNA_ID=CAMNT_0017173459 /DNA_START=12 /DNA_END=392 /DNA_ORIENTATION=+